MGYDKGERHFNSKLLDEQVKDIKIMRGIKSSTELAIIYNVARITIYKIWDGSMWKHINAI